MTRHLWSRKASSAMVVTLIGAWAAFAAVASPATAESGCSPHEHDDAITSFTLSDTTLQGSQTVRIDFAGALPDGSCAGDTVVIEAPTNFPLKDGSTAILDPDGVRMGTMTVADNVVTLTFDDYVETHDHVTFSGFFWGNLSDSSADTDYDLVWQVGATTISTPVHTNLACNCSGVRTSGSKGASLGDDHRVNVHLTTATTQDADELITYTDVVGEGQQVDCSSFVGWYGTTYNQYGGVILSNHLPVTVVSCDDAGFTATMTSTAPGQVLDLQVHVNTTEELPSYSDEGTITQASRAPDHVSASAKNYGVGVQGSGDTLPSPTPTPTDPTPTTPAPTDPAPTTPAPTDPAPTTPAPTDPAPTDPAPTDPTPTPPAPTDPAPTDPTPTDPAPTDPTPTDRAPTDPAPTDPTPTEPTPTMPAPTEPEATDPTPVVQPPTTQPPTTQPPTAQPPVDGPARPPADGSAAAPVSQATTLPNTGMGSRTPELATTGILFLAAGSFLVAVGRRRRVYPR